MRGVLGIIRPSHALYLETPPTSVMGCLQVTSHLWREHEMEGRKSSPRYKTSDTCLWDVDGVFKPNGLII